MTRLRVAAALLLAIGVTLAGVAGMLFARALDYMKGR